MEELLGQGNVAILDYIIAMHAKSIVLDSKLNILLEMQLKAAIAADPGNEEEIRKEFFDIVNNKAEMAEKEMLEFLAKNMR